MLAELTTQDITTICNTVLGAMTLISGVIGIIFGYLAKKSANRAEDHGAINSAKIDMVVAQTNGVNTKMGEMASQLGFAVGQKEEKEAEAARVTAKSNAGNLP